MKREAGEIIENYCRIIFGRSGQIGLIIPFETDLSEWESHMERCFTVVSRLSEVSAAQIAKAIFASTR